MSPPGEVQQHFLCPKFKGQCPFDLVMFVLQQRAHRAFLL